MGNIRINFDVHIINDKEYVPFNQVMDILKELDKHTPNVDLNEMIKALKSKRDEARAHL